MTKNDAGFVVLIVALTLGGGAAALAAVGPALVAAGIFSVKTMVWLIAGGFASALALMPAWVALAD